MTRRHDTQKRHCLSGLGGFEAVQTGACCAREVYAACGSRDWAGSSPTSPPRQPHGSPSRSRARTGAPDGISGGAFWTSAARQTRLYVTFPSPRSGRIASDVSCEHIADAGEGKRGVNSEFTLRMHNQQARGGQIGAGDAMDAVEMGRRTA